ncbi:MAG: aminofutalosine synthase MqnE, partial [Actinomycetota bacterium]
LCRVQPFALKEWATVIAAMLAGDQVVMLEEDVTQEGLRFGLDDRSGTLVEERVAHATTVQTPLGLTRDRISDLIRGGGRTPVERNTTYGRVAREAVSA